MRRQTQSSTGVPRTIRPRPSGTIANVCLLAAALVVSALLGEAMVRIAMPGFPGFRLPQVEHRVASGLGFEMVPNQIGYSNASRVTVNSAGFRGSEIRDLSTGGYPRVLCLGDSMTMGVAVEDDETYPSQLQQMLARYPLARNPEVINAGVQRYFTFQEIDVLKRHVEKLRPDIVTLGVYINDLGVRPKEDLVRDFENEREQAATAFRRRFPTMYLVLKNSALLEMAKIAYFKLEASRRSGSSYMEDALAGRTGKRDESKWQGVEQEFVTFKDLAGKHRFTPIVVFVPVRQQVTNDLPMSLYPRRLVEHARRIGIVTIDPTERFKEALRRGSDPYLPWDDHLSVAGHRIVAQAIAAELNLGTSISQPSESMDR